MSNNIQITKCDNELIVLALQGNQSYELCNIKSGNNNSVIVHIDIDQGEYTGAVKLNGVNGPLNAEKRVALPAGEYTLVYAGVNWGGPYQFAMTVNGEPRSLPAGSAGEQFGFIWDDGNDHLQITV